MTVVSTRGRGRGEDAMAVQVQFLFRLNVQRKETSTSMRRGLRCDRYMGFSGKKITRPKEHEKENNF